MNAWLRCLLIVVGVHAESLRSQFVTLDGVEAAASSAQARGKHLNYRPYAFTEQGVAMLSSVLRSDRAVMVNIASHSRSAASGSRRGTTRPGQGRFAWR